MKKLFVVKLYLLNDSVHFIDFIDFIFVHVYKKYLPPVKKNAYTYIYLIYGYPMRVFSN